MSERGEIILWQRALRNRWPVPEAAREALMARLFGIALNPASSVRTAISAARAIATFDALNLGYDTLHVRERIDERLAAIEREIHEPPDPSAEAGALGEAPEDCPRPDGLP